MKIHLFFEEDNKNINEYTDFKSTTGLYDLNDLRKFFKSYTLDTKRISDLRAVEGINLLFKGMKLSDEVIKNRLRYSDKLLNDNEINEFKIR